MFESFITLVLTVISTFKEFWVQYLPILAPFFFIGIVIGLIKLMMEEILSTKIGATIVLGGIAIFLINQGVI